MTTRRDFLKRAAQLVALGVAGDQLELLDRLTHRKVFAGIDMHRSYLDQFNREWVAVIRAGQHVSNSIGQLAWDSSSRRVIIVEWGELRALYEHDLLVSAVPWSPP